MSRPVAQVLEAFARASRRSQDQEAAAAELQRGWCSGANVPELFSDFIPIRLVTLIEAQVRYVIAQAIDTADPFTTNATKLIDRWSAKQVLEALLAVNQGRITIGELAAHSITIGSYQDAIDCLEKIFGPAADEALQDTTEYWVEEVGNDVETIISDFDATRLAIKRLFHIRHILVHETPAVRPYEILEIPPFTTHTQQFIAALHWYGVNRTLGRVPQTQLMMTLSAHDDAAEAEAALWELRQMSKDEAALRSTRKHEAEAAWDQFALLSAEEATADLEGASLHSMERSSVYANLNWWRVERLRKEAQRTKVD